MSITTDGWMMEFDVTFPLEEAKIYKMTGTSSTIALQNFLSDSENNAVCMHSNQCYVFR